jgi:hypothetical protein
MIADGIPPFLYHGTFEHHMHSILESGLGAKVTRRNFEISLSGVSLNDDPDAAYSWAADNQFGNQGDVIILEIDTAQLDRSLLQPDGNDEDGERGGISFHYRGIIPRVVIARLDGMESVLPRGRI